MRKSILSILACLGIGIVLIFAANFWISDLFTCVYVSVQIVVGLSVFGVMWWQNGWYTHTNTAASILTMVGVFGTFIGIYIGLQEFNPKELQGSIETLLNGLKLAFLTSIVGIGSALLLKGIVSPLAQRSQRQSDEDPEQETIGRFVDVLTEALSSVETTGERNLSSKLETLTTDIKKGNETTQDVLRDMASKFTNIQSETLDQLKTLTKTVSDEHNQLRVDRETTRSVFREMKNDFVNQLETLTNTVSDKNDLIVASQKNEATETRKTLTDMQSELTDRQSKNFIQLRTLTKTVAYEHNQLRKEFENFSKNVAASITELATKELISSLTKVIENFNTQLSTQFGDNFKQLNEAVGKTVDWQEQYRNQMDDLANQFQIAAQSIEKSRDSLTDIANSSTIIADRSDSVVTISENLEPILHTLNDQLGAFSDLREKANDAFPLIEKRLDDLTTKFSDTVQVAITDSQAQSAKLKGQFDQFEKVINGLDDFTKQVGAVTTDVSGIVKDLETIIDSQTKALQNSASYVTTMQTKLDAQLTASISELGTNLAALSQRFVDDYTPLTQSLREVLTIADGILPKQSGN